jgi:hypothetical protein
MVTTNYESETLDRTEGIVQHVDVVGRVLTVQVNGISKDFNLAPDCAIVLHGERVKLRLVQPDDHVSVVFSQGPAGLMAHAVEVSWQLGRPATTNPNPAAARMAERRPSR